MTPLDPSLQGWQNFYILIGTAAATLTGLMFIAVTFGASLLTRERQAFARAFLSPIYFHFVQVLLTAALLTVPTLGRMALGIVFIALAAWRLANLAWVFRRYWEAHRKSRNVDLSDWVLGIALPFACHGLLLATAIGFLMGVEASFTGLAIVTLGLLLVGIQGAWEQLVWIAMLLTERQQQSATASPAKSTS
jgi:hypothetical protein